MDPRDGLLAYSERLVPLSDDEREAVRERLRVREIGAGESWVAEGETCRDVAFVASGVLRIYFLSDGDEVTAYFAREGEMVSDYESFLTGAPARQTIEAVEPATLAVLSREDVRWAWSTLTHGERLGRLIAERLFLATHDRLAGFYLDSAEDRYARLLDEQPDLAQRMPQHILASYVGVRPQSLSRIRRRMADRGSSPG